MENLPGISICSFLFLLFIIPIAILGTRNRIREANEIFRKRKSGEYDKWSHGKGARFIRVFSVIQLIVVSLMLLMLALMVFNPSIVRNPFIISALIIIAMFEILSGIFIRRLLIHGKA